MIELVTRVLCDPLPDARADAAHLFSQTVDNQASVLDAGADLVRRGIVGCLTIWGSEAQVGYPGSTAWCAELARRKVPPAAIVRVAADDSRSLNTRVEAEGLVDHTRTAEWKRIVVVAAPFHQVRAFMTAVSVALDAFPTLHVYSLAGRPLPWVERVAHSQGNLRDRRAALVGAELERIQEYQAKGDLVSQAAVLEYLDRRDARTFGPPGAVHPEEKCR